MESSSKPDDEALRIVGAGIAFESIPRRFEDSSSGLSVVLIPFLFASFVTFCGHPFFGIRGIDSSRPHAHYNPRMTALDTRMEAASEALARMDYLATETLCEEALAQAKATQDWAYYGRILLPLQECRRQRRMIAAEGVIRLGTSSLGHGPVMWPKEFAAGCVVLTHPHHSLHAARLWQEIRACRLFGEVLMADNNVGDATWRVRTFCEPDVVVEILAPPTDWRDRWLTPVREAQSAEPGASPRGIKPTPADWFIDASEKLGDALLATVNATSPADRVDELERCIHAAPDHEILHQRLADAAKAARLGADPSRNA